MWRNETTETLEAWMDAGAWWWRPDAAVLFGVLGAALLVAWRLLFTPLDWKRDLEDVGFDHVAGAVRLSRRLRRQGPVPPAYPNGWFALVESHEVRPGQVLQVSALGETFAVFREEASSGARVHVLGAYCPHLGANMAAGGRVRGACLECPFHGWRFSGADGRCVAVPYSASVPDFARARRWPSREVNHVVLVWHHADGEEPSWEPQPLPRVQSGEWRCRGRSRFYVNCHIQEIPENGADVAHLNVVHAPPLTCGADLRNACGSTSVAGHVWRASWAPSQQEGLRHTAIMTLRHELRFFNKFVVMGNDVEAHQIGPGIVVLHIQTCLGEVIIVQTVTPIEPMVQKVVHRMYASKFVVQPFANFMFYGETVMFERDVMVWNHKTYVDKPMLVSEDRAITRYRRWYGQFYSKNSRRKDSHPLEW